MEILLYLNEYSPNRLLFQKNHSIFLVIRVSITVYASYQASNEISKLQWINNLTSSNSSKTTQRPHHITTTPSISQPPNHPQVPIQRFSAPCHPNMVGGQQTAAKCDSRNLRLNDNQQAGLCPSSRGSWAGDVLPGHQSGHEREYIGGSPGSKYTS